MSDRHSRGIVGREQERAQLAEAVVSAAAGRGSTLLLRGEAGIGKSTLLDEAQREAQARGFEILRGFAWELAAAPAYFPLAPGLRKLGVDEPSSEGGVFAFYEAVLSALARSSEQRPVAWLLEDLQAADEASLELLCFLTQAARPLACCFVLTQRTHDERLTVRGRRLLARIAKQGNAIDLGPLAPAEVLALSAARASGALSKRLKARIVELCSGNPLFVLECIKALPGRPDTLPATLSEAVTDQLLGFGETTRTALACGATLGSSFSAHWVAGMQGALAARVIDELAPALRSGMLRELAPGRFAFAHALTREAVYRAVSAEERLRLHARAEEVLAHTGDSAGSGLIERAHHALCARAPGREDAALALTRQALVLAEQKGAYDRAFALASAAHALRLERPQAAPLHAAELLALARLARLASLRSEHRELCGQASTLAQAEGDVAGFAQAALELAAELRPAVVDPGLIAALETALATLGSALPGLACQLRARLSAALQPALDPQGPVRMAREAIAQAERLADDAVLCEVLYYAGSALSDYAPLDERVARASQLLACATKLERPARALIAHARLLVDLLAQSDFVAFDAQLTAMRALAAQVGHPRLTFRASLLTSMRALAEGDLRASERCCVEVEQMAGFVDDPALAMALAAHSYHRARASYRADLLEARLREITEHLSGVPDAALIYRMLEAAAYAFLGEPARVAPLLSGVSLPELAARDTMFHCLVAEAVAACGSAEQARAVLRCTPPVLEYAGGHILMSYDGPVARLRGLLLFRCGELDAAERALSQALVRLRVLGFRPWIARVTFELSELERARGRTAEAERQRDEARALAEALELDGLCALIDRRAPSAQSDVREPVQATRPEVSLTREGELWRLCKDEREVRLRDSRGIQLLERLIARPDQEQHVLALASDAGTALLDSDAGEVIDADAARAYRQRLAAIEGALETADAQQAALLTREQTFLEEQLRAAIGMHGLRRSGASSERARVNVQRRLKDALRRVAEADPALGGYLTRAIRTGTYCCFRP